VRLVLDDLQLFDGRGGLCSPVSVAIEGDRIAAIGTAASLKAQPGDERRSLSGRSVMPGMFSCHFHGSFEGETLDYFPLGIGKPPGYLMLRAARAARLALDAGFTSLIGAGSGDDLDAQLALAIEDGLVVGSRITPGSRNLGTPSGYIDLDAWWWKLGNTGACRMVDGPDECRRAVRDEIKRGARIIKVFATGGHGNLRTATSEFSRAELDAIVAAAHERGARVRAHCAWKEKILECVAAGVDVIDHGDEVDRECIDAMAAAGTFFVPSALYLQRLLELPDLRKPEYQALIDATQRELDDLCRAVPEANAAGVPIVLGDDYGTVMLPHGSYADEIEFYVKQMGVAPLEVLRWATHNGARMAGRERELGTLEVGKLADLVVVDGDPMVDLSILSKRERIAGVMKGGRWISAPAAATAKPGDAR
jgi:imidazolonepropionase-like amidohydrolase